MRKDLLNTRYPGGERCGQGRILRDTLWFVLFLPLIQDWKSVRSKEKPGVYSARYAVTAALMQEM